MDNNKTLEHWYRRYLANDLSEKELADFLSALRGQDNEQIVLSLMDNTWQEMYPEVGERIMAVRKNRMIRYLVAASAVAIISIGIFLLMFNQRQQRPKNSQLGKVPIQNDIQPGGDKAVLTLADGRKIVLDTAANGVLTQQSGIKIIKIGGQLTYNTETTSTQVLYNTITTPKGGQYQLELTDGSKVWLNAASSLRFPTAFTGKERAVELTGEGFFEVVHNAAMPFRVTAGGTDIKDLGTAFNITAYPDEETMRATVVNGRVLVTGKNASAILMPGQQAQLTGEKLAVNKDVDVGEVIAWKNGLFEFTDADIKTIMQQLARWYDVEIHYSEDLPTHITGEIPRNLSLQKTIKVLEESGLHLKLEGKNLYVLP